MKQRRSPAICVLIFLFVCVSGYTETPVQTGEKLALGIRPARMVLTPEGDFLYISSIDASSVSVIDTALDRLVHTIKVSGTPSGLIALPQNNRMLIVTDSNKLHIIDALSHNIVDSISTPYVFRRITVTHNGDLFFGLSPESGKLIQINLRSRDIVAEWSVPSTAADLAVSQINRKIYVSYSDSKDISVYSMKSAESKPIDSDDPMQILVRFHPDTQESQITTMMDNLGLQPVKTIKALNIRVFALNSDRPVESVIAACEQLPYVKYAEVNQKYKTQQ